MNLPTTAVHPVPVGDAFGGAVVRAWRAGGGPGLEYEIIERDDGLLTVNDVAKYFAPFPEWGRLEQLACERAVGRTLDIGCGPGRHAVHLLAAGLDVLGLEPSAGAAAVARERGVPVREIGIEAIGTEAGLGMFDTLLLGGQSVGLLGSAERAPAVLTRIASVARVGGSLLAVGMDPSALSSREHLDYAQRNRDHGRLPGQQRFRIRHRAVASPWFDYLFASGAELEALAAGTPWRLDELVPEGRQYLARFTRAF